MLYVMVNSETGAQQALVTVPELMPPVPYGFEVITVDIPQEPSITTHFWDTATRTYLPYVVE